MDFLNVYEDNTRAVSYSKLEYPNTYYLAFRDLPNIILHHCKGTRALDFGCGTGRSTRFLKSLGFESIGVDISVQMIGLANDLDRGGEYLHLENGYLDPFESNQFDLILSAFTFDNIPSVSERVNILKSMKRILKPNGIIILLDSTTEIYLHEWASFSTCMYPENALAQSGDIVKIIMKDVEDTRPVEDILWKDEDYRHCFKEAELDLSESYLPLGHESEPYPWINETCIPPWIIYLLEKTG